MPRIDVPDGQDPLIHLWAGTATGLTGPAAAFSDAVYKRNTLELREFEAARITIARVNDCNICLNLRADGGPDQDFYDAVLGSLDGLTEREALAAEFAQKFATDHLNLDDSFWQRLHASYTDDELVQLGLCVGSWLAFGRLNRVFDVDGVCRIPLNPHGDLHPIPHV
ncbi:MAG TPA: carboxymuconolactone decarboxylase family protein [Nocardioidaceae bacterium]|nr:carboxymuconolactone decarboxylase family protein [Nocardioidaceae bacterium]